MTEIDIRQGVTTATTEEPSLTLTQLQELLRDAAALERASRPIVLHGPAQPAVAPQAAPQHPGVDIRYPAAPVTAESRSEHNWWPMVCIASGTAGACFSLVTAVTGSPYGILAVFASAGVWGTALYQLVFVREP